LVFVPIIQKIGELSSKPNSVNPLPCQSVCWSLCHYLQPCHHTCHPLMFWESVCGWWQQKCITIISIAN
jgi:hypothetical protein